MIDNVLQKLHWLGHDGFRIDADKVIYIDPYQIRSAKPADIMLVTHDHYDHCSPDDIRKIQQKSTVIVTDKASATKLSGDVRIVKPGDSLTVGAESWTLDMPLDNDYGRPVFVLLVAAP